MQHVQKHSVVANCMWPKQKQAIAAQNCILVGYKYIVSIWQAKKSPTTETWYHT